MMSILRLFNSTQPLQARWANCLLGRFSVRGRHWRLLNSVNGLLFCINTCTCLYLNSGRRHDCYNEYKKETLILNSSTFKFCTFPLYYTSSTTKVGKYAPQLNSIALPHRSQLHPVDKPKKKNIHQSDVDSKSYMAVSYRITN